MIRFIRTALIVSALLVTLLDFFGFEEYAESPYHGIRHNNLVFFEFEKESPNKDLDLVQGDHIHRIDGTAIRNINHFKDIVYSKAVSEPMIFNIARGDSFFDVAVLATEQPHSKIYQKIALSVTAFTFMLVGLYVVIKRPDILGVLFTVNCLIFSFLLTERPAVSPAILHILGELVYDCVFAFLPAFFLHFFLIFPGKEIERGSRRSTVSRILYIPPAVLFLSFFSLALANYTRGVDPQILLISNAIVSIYWAVYMIGGVVLFIRTYVTSSRVQRVKFRIATLGLAAGIIPLSLVLVLRQFSPSMNIPYDHMSVIFLSFISISFAYAILKHDAFDMRVVFRMGLAYVLMPALLAGAVYLFTKSMGEKFPDFPGTRHYPMMVIAMVMALIAFVMARTGIQKLADWLFFRNRKILRERVVDFSRKIQFITTLEEISSFVAAEIYDLFEPQYVHIFLMENENYTFVLRRSCPTDANSPLTSLSTGTELIELAARKRQPVMTEYFDRLWIKNNLDRISLELLSILKVSSVVPLIEQNEMLGFILLGRKRSGRPFTGADSDILELIGERSAAAIRHNFLYGLSIEKEKLEKEVHLASKIQQRLLPESPPVLRNSMILGKLRNSREIGGDFFDYVDLSENVIGIAVADVSGKGIPASLLMTTLQATFRSEAMIDKTPGQVLSALNRSLFKRSELSKFATFFYAVYNDETGILHYSNGGSFPPIVARADGTMLQLKRGGILIGVAPDSEYSEGMLKLRPGDIVAIYTDGIIDQENSTEEYFGEKRFFRFLKQNSNLDPEHLVEKLYETLLSFGEGMIKDDMTLVILKRNARTASETSGEKEPRRAASGNRTN